MSTGVLWRTDQISFWHHSDAIGRARCEELESVEWVFVDVEFSSKWKSVRVHAFAEVETESIPRDKLRLWTRLSSGSSAVRRGVLHFRASQPNRGDVARTQTPDPCPRGNP